MKYITTYLLIVQPLRTFLMFRVQGESFNTKKMKMKLVDGRKFFSNG